jgi:hypothetical protein
MQACTYIRRISGSLARAIADLPAAAVLCCCSLLQPALAGWALLLVSSHRRSSTALSACYSGAQQCSAAWRAPQLTWQQQQNRHCQCSQQHQHRCTCLTACCSGAQQRRARKGWLQQPAVMRALYTEQRKAWHSSGLCASVVVRTGFRETHAGHMSAAHSTMHSSSGPAATAMLHQLAVHCLCQLVCMWLLKCESASCCGMSAAGRRVVTCSCARRLWAV